LSACERGSADEREGVEGWTEGGSTSNTASRHSAQNAASFMIIIVMISRKLRGKSKIIN
jgi:hypothetical protein